MRIISGTARGRRLKSPPTKKVRPTTDRVRESLFGILGDLHGVVVVDGFAGSGALGLEALSRGAAQAYFFDTSRVACQIVEENASILGFEERALIKRCTFVEGLSAVKGTPDLFFIDPPYGTELAREALEKMSAAPETVTAGALVVWESGRDEPMPEVEAFEVVDERIYGSTRIVFLRRTE